MLAGCHRSPEVENQCASIWPELAAIDTLMEGRPDSALCMLLDKPVDDPYYQLLLSEALYRNDSTQLNRHELQRAMLYFDSVDCVFLSARSHYMNGVGYYEMDSVVPACEEYLKALEIMEGHFADKELVGYKAKFMALTYTHLCGLFSDHYLPEQAICFGKRSLPYYLRNYAESWHIAWILDEIGSQYYMMARLDSANYYFDRALHVLPDTTSMTFRDVTAVRSLLSYYTESNPRVPLERFHGLLSQAKNGQEYLARCLNIGEIFYHEKEYDSALVYLTKVFGESDHLDSRKQAAEWLVEICKSRGEDTGTYAEFLVPFANKEENKSAVKSQLTEVYKVFWQNQLERQHHRLIKTNIKWTIIILVGFLFVLFIVTILYFQKKKRLSSIECQVKQEQSRTQKRKNLEQLINEDVCQKILCSLKGNTIKRSATPLDYPELVLDNGQLQLLILTVNRYFGSFGKKLEQYGIATHPNLLNLCYLYLLGVDEKQASILLNKDYSSIKRYEKKLRTVFKTQSDLAVFIRNLAVKN